MEMRFEIRREDDVQLSLLLRVHFDRALKLVPQLSPRRITETGRFFEEDRKKSSFKRIGLVARNIA